MKKLFINGIDVTEDIFEGLESFEIELGLNTSTKTIGKTLTSDITLEGNSAKYLYDYFFENCDAWQKKIKAIFKTDICGGIIVDCEITSEGLSWTPETKRISFNLKSGDKISEAYARLDSEYCFANGFIETNDTPIMFYVDEPNWIQWAVILMTSWTRVIFNIIDLIIGTICKAINILPGIDLNCDKLFSKTIFESFDTWITGTGRWSVCPILREMISHQCNAVGLKFVSSILNDPNSSRYNASIFCLTGGENGDYKDTSKVRRIEIFNINAPLYTTTGLLDKLKDCFKADYRIIGDTLYFEPETFFDEIRTIEMLDTKDHCLEEPIKISYNIDDAVAYGEYMYTQDAYDNGANILIKPTYNYQEKLEFNVPYNPAQKGKKVRQIGFGASRFMFDEVSFKSKGFFNFGRLMDEFRNGPESFIEGFIANEGIVRKLDLKLTSSSLSVEKLLILEPNFNRKDALVVRTKLNDTYYSFNRPLHLDEDSNYSELTKDYLYLDNPRLRKDIYKVDDFTIECDCNAVLMALNNFQETFVSDANAGKIISEKIVVRVDESKVSIEFTNNRAICK